MSDDRILSQGDIDALVESMAPGLGSAGKKGTAARTSTSRPPPAPTSSPPDIRALTEKMTEMANRLEKLEKTISKLEHPADGNTRMTQFAQNFRCTSCNSQGFLAFFVKCTHCGQIKLWGSWPTK